MRLYAESSAVLSLLLGEEALRVVGPLVASAERVLSSALTLVECERTLSVAMATGRVDEHAAVERRNDLRTLARRWDIIPLGPEVLDRAGQPFPNEPIRTLDAIHLASALLVRPLVPDLIILSLDERLRRVAESLGFPVLPETTIQEASP